jgi:hypothetical protein
VTARGLALAIAAPFAILLTIAGFAALGLVLGCVVYLTLKSMSAKRHQPRSRRFDRLS